MRDMHTTRLIDDTRSAILESYRPALIPLSTNLTVAAFPLMKVYPADYCVRRAIVDGMRSETLVIESSSGTLALGLAIVSKCRGLRLTIVTDHACDDPFRRRLEDLGAHVEIVSRPAVSGGFQRARLDRLHEIRRKETNAWWVNQYDNPANPVAYSALAAQLLDSIGKIDCLVGTVGSGGSMCGTATYLRMLLPSMKAIGVDTFGSVLFGQPDAQRKLRGLGNSILPANLDHTVFDEIHWVSAAEAFTATRRLHQETTLFRGPTSGAAWLVARFWAAKNPDLNAVCLLPDDGTRYRDTAYDDRYLSKEGLWLDRLPAEPRQVNNPVDASGVWSCMNWQRRTYESATGKSRTSNHEQTSPELSVAS
jgi:cysteine synthase